MQVVLRNLGLIDYSECFSQMRDFTEKRDENSLDEFWLVKHEDIYTIGLAGLEEHILNRNHNIPILRVDRGGQVTYHGPGQIILYILLNLKRLNLGVRELVCKIEEGVIDFLAKYQISANGDRSAPGVYVNQQKIASLGLKIRKGATYHGLSFNYQIDKSKFSYINPCGYKGLQVTNLVDLIKTPPTQESAALMLAKSIIQRIYIAHTSLTIIET